MSAYEDIAIGETMHLGAHTFTAERIKDFALQFDPQPFHVDEVAAKESFLGGLCASGWHTASVMMKLTVAAFQPSIEAGEDSIMGGPSPGIEDMKWLKPVYAGDTITYTKTAIAKRLSRSRPGWGIVSFRSEGINQRGEPVFQVTSHVLARSREVAGS